MYNIKTAEEMREIVRNYDQRIRMEAIDNISKDIERIARDTGTEAYFSRNELGAAEYIIDNISFFELKGYTIEIDENYVKMFW